MMEFSKQQEQREFGLLLVHDQHSILSSNALFMIVIR